MIAAVADMRKPIVGILALQGAVQPHVAHLEALGCTVREVRLPRDLDSIGGLILPGGESTTLLKLIALFEMDAPLMAAARRMPFWGICAGSILMASSVTNPAQRSFRLMNFGIRRNAYGRQNESFNHVLETRHGQGLVSFIRAPQITAVETEVETLAEHAGLPVWLEQGPHMVTTFHAELSVETPSFAHRYFLQKVNASCAAVV